MEQTIKVICSQKINPGIRCDAPITFRYAFDVRHGSCQPYSYQGCSGNSNSFLSVAQCESFCLQVHLGSIEHLLVHMSGLCFKGLPFWKHGRIVRCDLFERICPLEHYCVVPVYGPATSRICCPSASIICALNKAEGNFCHSNQTNGSVSRFYFDFHTRSCVEFQFKGCGENGNNFETSEKCLKFCSGFIAVPYSIDYGKQYSPGNAGQHVSVPACNVADHKLAPGSMYYRCDPKLPFNCPDGYSCQRSFNNHEYICCGFPSVTEKSATQSSICSSHSSGFSKLENYKPLPCVSKIDCPLGLTCQFIRPLGRHFCCPPMLPKSSDYHIAGLGVLNDCPIGELYLYPPTGQPLSCRLEVDHCPMNYYCQVSEAAGVGICCPAVLSSHKEVFHTNAEITDVKTKECTVSHVVPISSVYINASNTDEKAYVDVLGTCYSI
ncbi:Kunitz BPTI and Lustrin cystein domain containing protein [Trichuris trichiura]|uniref:Kunitz BPTI and Lustrin cystein domain containing protein n=1 Tax=Trichuris trichiura TaxID=36087 RepID=A0A077ZE89_TRITR|nr:Kunitz BPTI and Lustrin cystein domain containing protein [Trichuris trichiura]